MPLPFPSRSFKWHVLCGCFVTSSLPYSGKYFSPGYILIILSYYFSHREFFYFILHILHTYFICNRGGDDSICKEFSVWGWYWCSRLGQCLWHPHTLRSAVQVLYAPLPIQLHVNVPVKTAKGGTSSWPPLHPCGRFRWRSCLPASAWPSPGCYCLLGSEPVNKRFSDSPLLFL